ncbi:MAG: hypothetical protein KAY65_02145 [Planctomycetes bacterium]|nr:hypothetical protein [Planctomycetota bacterium]
MANNNGPGNRKYVKDVAKELCENKRQLKFVLTALAIAVQERLGEDVILYPRGEASLSTRAIVYNCKFIWRSKEVWQHIIRYKIPENDPPRTEELLRITLDVAHELGHLLLDRGPGRMPARIGIPQSELDNVREVEADWLALCVLQMYGFIFPPKQR